MDESTRVGGAKSAQGPVTRLAIAVARGPDAGSFAEIGAGETASIGTAEDNDVRLRDPTVSRYHLELAPARDGIRVRDLGSTNGTFLGSVRIETAVVPRGTQLRVGDSVIVVDGAEPKAPVPPSMDELPGLVIASEPMREIARRVRSIAALASPVLVQGETGTGKELVTRAIHDLSPVKDGPFVVVDCAALPAALLEAELFGHEKGAFTGAERTRRGAFERAEGGSVFLDEVGELPLVAQATLLGVLERKSFRRVGGDVEIKTSARVLAATNRDLRQEVNRGAFRADLYYRLAVGRIGVPPLRDRPEEIPTLARHFARELTGTDSAIDDAVIEALSRSSWPGNVRELRGAVERVIAFGPAEAGVEQPPPGSQPKVDAAAIEGIERYRDAKAAAIAAFDREYLTKLLEETNHNVSEAARRARMDRPYLIALAKRYGLR
jgi:transcriptional regulator with GAF, ATPase, and Fis domain